MIAILYNIRSIHNVGSIFRTADGAGVEKIYLGGITPSPLDELGRPRKPFVKVSLGAEKYVPWEKVRSAPVLLKKLKKDGFKIFAVEQDKRSIPYNRIKPGKNKKTALIVGHERGGVPRSILKLSDKILEIPMRGRKESLNVAVAFGIIAYHLS